MTCGSTQRWDVEVRRGVTTRLVNVHMHHTTCYEKGKDYKTYAIIIPPTILRRRYIRGYLFILDLLECAANLFFYISCFLFHTVYQTTSNLLGSNFPSYFWTTFFYITLLYNMYIIFLMNCITSVDINLCIRKLGFWWRGWKDKQARSRWTERE
jgi:hypothetical protein